MIFFSYLRDALLNLTSAKLRSFLAVLGILVGTAAIVALLSCGELATQKALEQFKALGTDLLATTIFQRDQGKSKTTTEEVSLSFWRQLPMHIPHIIHVAPYGTVYQNVSFKGHLLQANIIATDDELAKIVHIQMAQGHFVSFLQSYEQECVIGANIATQIQEVTRDNPIGQYIRVGDTLYQIIGITKPWQETGFFSEDVNHSIIIPAAGLSALSKEGKLNNAVMLLKKDSPIDDVIAAINFKVKQVAPTATVFHRSAKQIIASMENQGRIFTLLLSVIGGISLLVGGIGVMNVMLVSVSERKKEIGIRKAIGARNKEIQNLFLIESVLLSILGGSLGVILGLGFTRIVAYFSDWPFHIFPLAPIAGFAVSVATGIFFGFYPATRAAKLEPIICLRND